MTWKLSLGEPAGHLRVRRLATGRKQLQFDLTAFYEDLRQVCLNARGTRWRRKDAQRYNEWLLLKLDANKPAHQRAMKEIKAL
jgi:hypothetical protein